MKKIIIYIIVLVIALWIPTNRIDISNLEPVQAVWISKKNDDYIIATDTEDVGVGETVREALQIMKDRCEKIIYLDTAQYLLVSDNCKESIGEISEYLKQRVKVSVWNGEGKLKDVAQYMQTHRVGVRLKDYFSSVELPVIPGLEGQ